MKLKPGPYTVLHITGNQLDIERAELLLKNHPEGYYKIILDKQSHYWECYVYFDGSEVMGINNDIPK
tara:strand:+ start:639 stop:839 length:201 start_codon:yes stop_codon:yes gene_type:complete